MKNVALFLLVILLAGFSCRSWQARDGEKKVYFAGVPAKSEEELASLVFEKGDEIAYRELRKGHYSNSYKLFVYALYMANKYDLTEAYYDVYDCLALMHNKLSGKKIYDLDGLDETTRQMALDYLQKAYKRGDIRAAKALGEYYMKGKYFNKDMVLGKKLMMEYKDRR